MRNGDLFEQNLVAFNTGLQADRAPLVESFIASEQCLKKDLTFTDQKAAFTPGTEKDTFALKNGKVEAQLHSVLHAAEADYVVGVVAVEGGWRSIAARKDEYEIVRTSEAATDALALHTVQITNGVLLEPLEEALSPSARLRHALLRSSQIAGAICGINEILSKSHTIDKVAEAALMTRFISRHAARLLSEQGDARATFEVGAAARVVSYHADQVLEELQNLSEAGLQPILEHLALMRVWLEVASVHEVSAEHIGRDAIGKVLRLIMRER